VQAVAMVITEQAEAIKNLCSVSLQLQQDSTLEHAVLLFSKLEPSLLPSDSVAKVEETIKRAKYKKNRKSGAVRRYVATVVN
jgi:hypothetical protein